MSDDFNQQVGDGLGSSVQVQAPVPDVRDAAVFYERLGYRCVGASEGVCVVSDGVILIRLDEEPDARPGLVYFSDDPTRVADRLEAAGLPVTRHAPDRASLTDPNGVAVLLVTDATPPPAAEGVPLSRCGAFYELSIETAGFEATEAFWTALGFQVTDRARPGNSWATLTDGLLRIGLYRQGVCPHVFRTPALTYFEPDMAARLAGLKRDGWTFVQEMDLGNEDGVIDHGILGGPGGEHLFLFSV